MLIGGRVPRLRVDPIEDAHEPVPETDERVVQSEATIRGEQLLRVPRAHGHSHVGKRQSALEGVHAAVPLEVAGVVQVGRQAERPHGFGSKVALESGVVDGQHRTQATMERVTREGRAQVDRRQGRVPVVRVHDVGRRRDLWQDRQGRLAEKRESQCVVGIVTGIVAVDPRAVEEVRVLDEEDLRHALGVVVLRAV